MTVHDIPGLVAEDIEVRYGGRVAVHGLSLQAPSGRLTGLIGPNGAGKTTTFNVLSGLLRPSHGSISFFGEPIGHLSAARRAQRGLGRTFQRMELYDSLTVRANVELGREARYAGTNPLRHLMPKRGERQAVLELACEALTMCGLEDLAHRRVGTLSTGQRRLVELARAIAGDFRILLLDEPSSGLDRGETKEFGEILRRIIRERDAGILLVEHDMALVMDVCDYLYVIDFGEPIFEGTPAEVATSSVVRAAYLGSEAVGVA